MTRSIGVGKTRARPKIRLARGNTRRWRLVGGGLVAALAICLVVLLGGLAHPGHALAPRVYGVDDAHMQAAVNAAGWPQQVYNWCGVATVAAIADYRGGGVSQSGAAGYLNSAAATSPWGTPSYSYPGPAFAADIARDAGTDPRALATGLGGLAGGRYHALVDHWGAWDATIRLAADIAYSGQPISVIVDHGQHSVIVSQVYANGDPVRDPGSIYALEVWDPGYGSVFDANIQNAQHVIVGIGDWLYSDVYWGAPYEQNGNWDPDPAVGPYTYDPGQGEYQHLWIGNWVYIQPWGPAVSSDWSVDQQDLVIPGQHGELPPGYVLPTPTPVPGIRIARSAPTTIPPSPTAIQRHAQPDGSSDSLPSPPVAPVFDTVPSGVTICLGPYCLPDVSPLWLAVGGALTLLAIAMFVGAVVAQRRYTRQRQQALSAPSAVTVLEVPTEAVPLLVAARAADDDLAPIALPTPGAETVIGQADGHANGQVEVSGTSDAPLEFAVAVAVADEAGQSVGGTPPVETSA